MRSISEGDQTTFLPPPRVVLSVLRQEHEGISDFYSMRYVPFIWGGTHAFTSTSDDTFAPVAVRSDMSWSTALAKLAFLDTRCADPNSRKRTFHSAHIQTPFWHKKPFKGFSCLWGTLLSPVTRAKVPSNLSTCTWIRISRLKKYCTCSSYLSAHTFGLRILTPQTTREGFDVPWVRISWGRCFTLLHALGKVVLDSSPSWP